MIAKREGTAWSPEGSRKSTGQAVASGKTFVLPLSSLPAEEILGDLPGVGRDALQREADRLASFGYVPFCPAGGTYSEDPKTGIHACSVHGFVWSPRQPLEARGDEPFVQFLETLKTVRASFRFTDEGIRTKVSIERNAATE